MARRLNGDGTYVHIQPVQCGVCKKRTGCVLVNNLKRKCSLRDRPDRWMYQYVIKLPDGTKKRKSIYARTRKELQEKVTALLEAKGSNFNKDATMDSWLDVWETRYLSDTVRDSTKNFYRDCLKYVPKSIRDKRLSEITPVVLQEMFSLLLASGSIKKPGKPLSPTTVRSVRSTLITALDCAIDNGYLDKNPVRKTKPPKKEKKQMTYLSKEEILRLMEVAESGEYYGNLEQVLDKDGSLYLIKQWYTLIRVTLATGLRRGEVFGLVWNDINFETNVFHVHSNLQKGKLLEPKTAYSKRYISVDVGTMQLLTDWKTYQQMYEDGLGDIFDNEYGLVFTNILGHPVNYDTFRSRYFAKMVRAANLPRSVTFHTLRHTHATQLLASGIDAKTISTRLGHSSVAFTLQTYVHTTPETEREAACAIGLLLDKKE